MENRSIMLVTGGTSGIGKETVKALALTGASVVYTARDRVKAEETRKEISEETRNNDISYLICDLASLASVRECAIEFIQRHSRLDVLINNAGVFPQERQESADGIELNLAVNYVAPFLLTNMLLPLLKRSAPARIINVSSSMHAEGKIDFDDLESKEQFDKYKAYAQSKLALILFTKKLAKDLAGSGVTVNALHPGVVGTEMTMRNVHAMNPLAAFIFKRTLITASRGSETSVYLATAPGVANVSGEYFYKKKQAESAQQSHDTHVAEKLWHVAETYTALP